MSLVGEDTLDKIVRITGTITAGLFFGGALYINAVHIPAMKALSGPTLTSQFTTMFNRAKMYACNLYS
jgi:hypothetical protein